MSTLELKTPRDILEKAKRELIRLKAELNVDNVFNFFVTAYHIQDYIKNSKSAPQANLDAFIKGSEIQLCKDMCNQGKHLKLSNKKNLNTTHLSGTFGGAPFGALPFNSSGMWLVMSDNQAMEVEILANNVIKKWEEFFKDNNI
jgi:hypothetical protein